MLIVDTREQKPYIFKLPMIQKALKTGDYSVEGYEDLVAIERKSLDDFIGCVTTSRDRFKRELERGNDLKRFFVVIECNVDDIIKGKYWSKVSPESVIGSIIAWSIRYNAKFIFTGNRTASQYLVLNILDKFIKEEIENGKEQEKSTKKAKDDGEDRKTKGANRKATGKVSSTSKGNESNRKGNKSGIDNGRKKSRTKKDS